MYEATLADAMSFWLAFLQVIYMIYKRTFGYKTIPIGSLLFPKVIVLLQILARTMLYPTNCDFALLALYGVLKSL